MLGFRADKKMMRAPIQIRIMCLVGCSLDYGQAQSRVAEVEAARTQKELNPMPQVDSKWKSRIERIENIVPYRLLSGNMNGSGFGFGSVTPGSGFTAAPLNKRTDLCGECLTASVTAAGAINRSYFGRLDLSLPRLFQGRAFVDFNTTHRNISEMPYYGAGSGHSSRYISTDLQRNTRDALVTEGGIPHVKQHLMDFGSILESNATRPKDAWSGNEYVIENKAALVQVATLGFDIPRWAGAETPTIRGVGFFNSGGFDPISWKPAYPNLAFLRMDREDASGRQSRLLQRSRDSSDRRDRRIQRPKGDRLDDPVPDRSGRARSSKRGLPRYRRRTSSLSSTAS